MDFIESAAVTAFILRARSKCKKKKILPYPVASKRWLKSKFHKLYQKLRTHPKKFFEYYKMSIKSFDELLFIIGPHITHQNSATRNYVPPEERLSVTLRYLATGNSFRSLHHEYLIGATTIRKIVRDTCEVIWYILKPTYMAEKTQNDWIRIAQEFYERASFPNCIGAVDGKHIIVNKTNSNGNVSHNYKNTFSIILMALVDADYCFTTIDTGVYDSSVDSNIFKNTNLCKSLEKKQLNIPESRILPNDNNGTPMPFVILGDEAFALSDHVLRPYSNRNFDNNKRIYNYRLTKARRVVECAFNMLYNKWKIFHRPIDVRPEFCHWIIKTCCVLHNFIRKNDGIHFEDILYECPLERILCLGTRGNVVGVAIRDYYAKYFNSTQGSVPWQYEKS